MVRGFSRPRTSTLISTDSRKSCSASSSFTFPGQELCAERIEGMRRSRLTPIGIARRCDAGSKILFCLLVSLGAIHTSCHIDLDMMDHGMFGTEDLLGHLNDFRALPLYFFVIAVLPVDRGLYG